MRKFLIIVNYLAVIFIVWSAIIGFLITRGRGFEYHLWVSMASIVLTMFGHFGSAAYLVINKNSEKSRVFLILLNIMAVFFYLWATYAGYLIRQGIPFIYHLQVAITSFFFSVAAHVLSSLYLKFKYKQIALKSISVN